MGLQKERYLMPIPVDRMRSVPVYQCAEEDVNLDHWTPGAARTMRRLGDIVGVRIGCPGCGQTMDLTFEDGGWSLDSTAKKALGEGRAHPGAALSGLSITPDFTHSRENGGCGWKGRLKNGLCESTEG